MIKLDSIKIKNFCSAKDTMKREKIFPKFYNKQRTNI